MLTPLLAPRTLLPGAPLYSKGDVPGAAYLLLSGRVLLSHGDALDTGACLQSLSLLQPSCAAEQDAAAGPAGARLLELRAASVAALAPLMPGLRASMDALGAARDAALSPAALRAAAWPLSCLPDAALSAIACVAHMESLQPRAQLFAPAAGCAGLLCVLQGALEVTERDPGGDSNSVRLLRPGAWAGADALVLPTGRTSLRAAVAADGDAPTVVLSLPSAALRLPCPPGCPDAPAYSVAVDALAKLSAAWTASCGPRSVQDSWLLAPALVGAGEEAAAAAASAIIPYPMPAGRVSARLERAPPGVMTPVSGTALVDAGASASWAGAEAASVRCDEPSRTPPLVGLLPYGALALAVSPSAAGAVESLARYAEFGVASAAAAGLKPRDVSPRLPSGLLFPEDERHDAALLLWGEVDGSPGAAQAGTLLLRSEAVRDTAFAAAHAGDVLVAPACRARAGAASVLLLCCGTRADEEDVRVWIEGEPALGAALRVEMEVLGDTVSPLAKPHSCSWYVGEDAVDGAHTRAYAPEPLDVGSPLSCAVRPAPWLAERRVSVPGALAASAPADEAARAALSTAHDSGEAAFTVRVVMSAGLQQAPPSDVPCQLLISPSGMRLQLASPPSRLNRLCGGVPLAVLRWGAPGMGFCGARGDGGAAARAAYLQTGWRGHAMLVFEDAAQRNGALAAARALAERAGTELPQFNHGN
jgi:CRP-like cAMP-binding protein